MRGYADGGYVSEEQARGRVDRMFDNLMSQARSEREAGAPKLPAKPKRRAAKKPKKLRNILKERRDYINSFADGGMVDQQDPAAPTAQSNDLFPKPLPQDSAEKLASDQSNFDSWQKWRQGHKLTGFQKADIADEAKSLQDRAQALSQPGAQMQKPVAPAPARAPLAPDYSMGIGPSSDLLSPDAYKGSPSSDMRSPDYLKSGRTSIFDARDGGMVPPGAPGVDTVPAMMTGGMARLDSEPGMARQEFVMPADSTAIIGPGRLEAMRLATHNSDNVPRMCNGGKMKRYYDGGMADNEDTQPPPPPPQTPPESQPQFPNPSMNFMESMRQQRRMLNEYADGGVTLSDEELKPVIQERRQRAIYGRTGSDLPQVSDQEIKSYRPDTKLMSKNMPRPVPPKTTMAQYGPSNPPWDKRMLQANTAIDTTGSSVSGGEASLSNTTYSPRAIGKQIGRAVNYGVGEVVEPAVKAQHQLTTGLAGAARDLARINKTAVRSGFTDPAIGFIEGATGLNANTGQPAPSVARQPNAPANVQKSQTTTKSAAQDQMGPPEPVAARQQVAEQEGFAGGPLTKDDIGRTDGTGRVPANSGLSTTSLPDTIAYRKQVLAAPGGRIIPARGNEPEKYEMDANVPVSASDLADYVRRAGLQGNPNAFSAENVAVARDAAQAHRPPSPLESAGRTFATSEAGDTAALKQYYSLPSDQRGAMPSYLLNRPALPRSAQASQVLRQQEDAGRQAELDARRQAWEKFNEGQVELAGKQIEAGGKLAQSQDKLLKDLHGLGQYDANAAAAANTYMGLPEQARRKMDADKVGAKGRLLQYSSAYQDAKSQLERAQKAVNENENDVTRKALEEAKQVYARIYAQMLGLPQ